MKEMDVNIMFCSKIFILLDPYDETIVKRCMIILKIFYKGAIYYLKDWI